MLYKPYSMTPPPAPSFFPRSKNISPVNERNKSQNTKPAIKISPNVNILLLRRLLKILKRSANSILLNKKNG